MYNHNKAQQSKNRVHISWDILYRQGIQLHIILIDSDGILPIPVATFNLRTEGDLDNWRWGHPEDHMITEVDSRQCPWLRVRGRRREMDFVDCEGNWSWASYRICKIAGFSCARNAGNVFPATDFKGNCKLAIPACIMARASRTCRDACRDR